MTNNGWTTVEAVPANPEQFVILNGVEASELHITVRYWPFDISTNPALLEQVTMIVDKLDSYSGFDANVCGHALINRCFCLLVEHPHLQTAYQAFGPLMHGEQYPHYVPHMTLSRAKAWMTPNHDTVHIAGFRISSSNPNIGGKP